MKFNLLTLAALLWIPWGVPQAAPSDVKVAKVQKATKSKPAKAKATAKPKAGAKAKASAKGAQKSESTAATSTVASRLGGLRTENELQKEIAAARALLAREPGNADAQDSLAWLSVITTDWMLSAEALGNTAKAQRLSVLMKREFADVGARVQKFAQQGDPKSRQALGVFYGRGIVFPPNAEKACAEFKAVADRLPASAWHWAQCTIETASDEAWAQMERAALQGHAAAQEWIGRRCLGEFGATGKDFTCAREWLSQSASQGRPRSQALYAYLLNSGQGGPVDASRALRLYRLAAEQGDPDAENNLGEIYESGRGVEKSSAEAVIWYERAAEHGLASAQFNAGRLWAIGVADKKDPAKARAWLVQAEQKGIVQARQVLDWLDQDANAAVASPSKANNTLPSGSKQK